jgi:hypothetical protein
MEPDIKELNKTQLILLSLLITFVVSIATGIITVSLMQQVPKSVPQTINNVIQRTIEKVTTVPAPVVDNSNNNSNQIASLGDGDAVVYIYAIEPVSPIEEIPNGDGTTPEIINSENITNNTETTTTDNVNTDSTPTDTSEKPKTEPKPLGSGVIISDIGLILVDSNILNSDKVYRVVLEEKNFDATILKKFGNGFTILKITPEKDPTINEKKDSNKLPASAAGAEIVSPTKDVKIEEKKDSN